MIRNIAKRFIYLYWRYRYKNASKWFKKIKPIILKEGEEFLFEKGFLNNNSIGDLAEKWPGYVKTFEAEASEKFYLDWKGEKGAVNIAANILDQFSRPYVASSLIKQFGRNHQFRGTVLDFGCGTAAISLLWQREFAKNSRLLLADVENLPRDFVRYEIKKYGGYKTEIVDVDLKKISENSIDCVLCVDVLEHLANPSSVFRLIDSKLRKGGILILQAPWGGYPEHLKEAPIDWNKNGGKKLLKSDYKKIKNFVPFILSGMYKKK